MSAGSTAQPAQAEPQEPHCDPLREKITKKASVVFERKDSDGSSFWSLSARNSVVSMFESGPETTEEAEAEAPRKMLQKKRSSLSRQPDIEKVLEAAPVHEFQKVKKIEYANFSLYFLHVKLQYFTMRRDT